MIVYHVPDYWSGDPDAGTGEEFQATEEQAFEHARKESLKDRYDCRTRDGEGCKMEVEKIWLIEPTREGCVAMLNGDSYFEKSEPIAVFENGKRIK